MKRNPKVLGLALAAVFALGGLAAQGASAADSHQFKFDGQKTVLTGKNTGPHEFVLGGGSFAVKCSTATFESTVDAGEGKTDVDEITLKPNYGGCEFGGQPATIFVNDCAFVFDSDTTAGNPTGGKHAQAKIECITGNNIKIHTTLCTLTIGEQTISDAVAYENDTASSFDITATAKEIVVGKEKNTPGQTLCSLLPTGAIMKYTGTVTNECRTDEGQAQANPTTPIGTKEGSTTECSVADSE